MFSLIVFGAIALNRLGISQMPDVDFPIVSVSINYEGAAPEVVEADIIDPVEQRLLSIEGVKEMRSSARQGTATVTLEFDLNRNIDVALNEVQSALSQLRLPPQVDPPIIRKVNPEEDPILIISVYGDMSLKEMLRWCDLYFLDQLRFLPGVGEVSVGGFPDRNLRIWLDAKKLDAAYLTAGDVVETVRSQHLESAAGQYNEQPSELRVRWRGEGESVKEIEDIRIIRRSGQIIYDRDYKIADVAKVEDGLSDVRRIARVEGKQAVGIQIKKQRGTNEVDIAQRVLKKIDEIKEQFPANMKYRVNVDFTKSTAATVHTTIEKLWVAAIITIIVCFLFLGSIPAAVNILFSIPTSIVGTFSILYFSGFTLNLFTLLALTLAISIVVDDAIMLLENIVRHYRMGKNAHQAAYDGAMEVLPAATAATLAVMAVFLPVIFMDGIIGKFFFQFGITMSAAVLLSLLEAVTITPMRSAAFLSTQPKVTKFEKNLDHWFEKLEGAYRNSLRFVIRWKGSVLAFSILLFLLSMLIITRIKQEFVPQQDQDLVILQAQALSGSSLQTTDEIARKIEAVIVAEKDVTGFFVSVGSGGLNTQVNQIAIPITLKLKNERTSSHTEVMARMREKFKEIKGVRISMRDISARNLTSGRLSPLALSLRGPKLEILDEVSKNLIKALEDQKLAVDLDSDYRTGIPELEIIPNRKAMAERGVSVESIGQILATGIGGLRDGRYTADGRRYDIRFKFQEQDIQASKDILNLRVRNLAGNLIPLRELVTERTDKVSQAIGRVNRQRAISVFGNIGPGLSQGEVVQKAREIAKNLLPAGYTVALEGASAGLADSFKSLNLALAMGILVAFLILAVQFNSFVHPLSVLVALPFSISGALMALWVFGASLNLFSFIGLIVLIGIAKKNSIMMVEFTNQIRESGKSVSEALLVACPIRLRPIIMTSIATMAAATPLVFGSDMGSETRLPMGLTIVGGTLVSTLLTLFVVPSLYLILSRFERNKVLQLTTKPADSN